MGPQGRHTSGGEASRQQKRWVYRQISVTEEIWALGAQRMKELSRNEHTGPVCLQILGEVLFVFGFLGPHMRHMEFPRLRVKLEL